MMKDEWFIGSSVNFFFFTSTQMKKCYVLQSRDYLNKIYSLTCRRVNVACTLDNWSTVWRNSGGIGVFECVEALGHRT